MESHDLSVYKNSNLKIVDTSQIVFAYRDII